MPKVAIIGGSGLYNLEIKDRKSVKVETPYGDPSEEIVVGEFGGVEAAFLARHGRYHTITPGEINFRANAWALVSLGVERVISISAVGGMKEENAPGVLVFPDNFIDNTRTRKKSFYHDGVVGHISLATPVCPEMREHLYQAGKSRGCEVRNGGTYICIEGPNFSTKAESQVYRGWGVDVVGMTNVPEVNVCREAGMCYATIACVTDYDCWREEDEDVSIEDILRTLRNNVEKATNIVADTISKIAAAPKCKCLGISKQAPLTPFDKFPEQRKKDLAPIIRRLKG